MNCPACGACKTRILESRDDLKWMAKRRKRACLGCLLRWHTLEVEEDVLRALVEHAPPAARTLRSARKPRPISLTRTALDASREPF
jgi:transcriptional regulator NrdR family protein